jgi:hypothetical protein
VSRRRCATGFYTSPPVSPEAADNDGYGYPRPGPGPLTSSPSSTRSPPSPHQPERRSPTLTTHHRKTPETAPQRHADPRRAHLPKRRQERASDAVSPPHESPGLGEVEGRPRTGPPTARGRVGRRSCILVFLVAGVDGLGTKGIGADAGVSGSHDVGVSVAAMACQAPSASPLMAA